MATVRKADERLGAKPATSTTANTISTAKTTDEQFDEILRELDEIRRLASDLTPEQIEALQRRMVPA